MTFSSVLIMLLAAMAAASPQPDATKDASVIILGAGVAGIQAAAQLVQQGITDILIIESTGRIGGRMWNEEWEGLTIELGIFDDQSIPDVASHILNQSIIIENTISIHIRMQLD